MNRELLCAVHQLIGFAHAKQGYDLISLIQSMGLKKKEWDKMSIVLPKEMIEQIDEYFDKRKKKHES
jgi:aspartate carbamoyltransferase regulatory subunit